MKGKHFALAASMALAIGATTLVSWVGNPDTALPHFDLLRDTVPASKNLRDFDKELKQLDVAEEELRKFQHQDLEKMLSEAREQIENIDFEKIRLQALEQMKQAEVHMKQVDIAKIQRDVEESLNKIDFDSLEKELLENHENLSDKEKRELKKELEEAKKEIARAREQMKKELEDAKKEMKTSTAEQRKQIEKELEEARKDIERSREDLKNQRVDIRKEMEEAHKGLQQARTEIKGYQQMVYEMESEGLLDTKTDYTIEFKSDRIKVNGKALSDSQNSKYSKYFKDDNIEITKKNGNINIRNEN